jgi:hypothetical protein
MNWNFFSREYQGGPLDVSVTVVPEPSAALVFATGLALVQGARRFWGGPRRAATVPMAAIRSSQPIAPRGI